MRIRSSSERGGMELERGSPTPGGCACPTLLQREAAVIRNTPGCQHRVSNTLCHNWVGVVITLLCVASSFLPTLWLWLVGARCSIPQLRGDRQCRASIGGCSNGTQYSDIHCMLPACKGELGWDWKRPETAQQAHT